MLIYINNPNSKINLVHGTQCQIRDRTMQHPQISQIINQKTVLLLQPSLCACTCWGEEKHPTKTPMGQSTVLVSSSIRMGWFSSESDSLGKGSFYKDFLPHEALTVCSKQIKVIGGGGEKTVHLNFRFIQSFACALSSPDTMKLCCSVNNL